MTAKERVRKRGISPKQVLFVEHYMANGCNAAKAYAAAYQSTGNSSTATKEGRRILGLPQVKEYIAQVRGGVANLLEHTHRTLGTPDVVGEAQAERAPTRERSTLRVRGSESLPVSIGVVRHTREWTLDWFETILARSLQAVPVLDGKGAPTGEYKFDASGANNALVNIAKITGVLIERRELTVKNVSEMTPEEIRARRRELALAYAEEVGEEVEDIAFTDSQRETVPARVEDSGVPETSASVSAA